MFKKQAPGHFGLLLYIMNHLSVSMSGSYYMHMKKPCGKRDIEFMMFTLVFIWERQNKTKQPIYKTYHLSMFITSKKLAILIQSM